MTKPSFSRTSRSKTENSQANISAPKKGRRRTRRSNNNSDVLVSAVVSSYLLTHLHHVLQRAEYGATRDGRASQAANYAQLRKVLCMDARSMKDASAAGVRESNTEKFNDSFIEPKAA